MQDVKLYTQNAPQYEGDCEFRISSIENEFKEFPHHLETQEGKAFRESITMCLGSKDSKCGVDYRADLVKSTAFVRQNHLQSGEKSQILDTLREMQRILYGSDEKRTPQPILRYYNQ